MDPEQNSMNWILPAYETMWRVVMRCFLEIRFGQANNDGKWSHVLAKYLEKIKDAKAYQAAPGLFTKAGLDLDGIAPIYVIKEALRSYLPTRQVHREFDGKTFPADIEECHRLEILHGENPSIFKPERWQRMVEINDRESGSSTMGKEGRYGFMPFALLCPAGGRETHGIGFANDRASGRHAVQSDRRRMASEGRLRTAGPGAATEVGPGGVRRAGVGKECGDRVVSCCYYSTIRTLGRA
jgi:hypothetical protein